MRLQKYLALCGISSRRKAESLIAEGKVQINGEVITEFGHKVDPEIHSVKVSGKVVKPIELGLIMMNKPLGAVTTKSDPDGRSTVMDLVDRRYSSYFPIGRLDINTTGILLLTNDGDLAERLSHPRYRMDRVYRVRVNAIMTKADLKQLNQGVKLSDGFIKPKCRLTKTEGNSSSLEIVLHEGRNRIVRRLVEHLGYKVIALKRIQFGPFKLGTLKPGETRLLKKADYLKLKEQIFAA